MLDRPMYALTSWLAEARPVWPLKRSRADLIFAALLLPVNLVEAVYEVATWKPIAVLLSIALAVVFTQRRERPLPVFLLSFVFALGVDAVALIVDAGWKTPATWVYLLLLPYTLFRWGSGRHATIGLFVIFSVYGWTGFMGEITNAGEAVATGVLFLFPVVLGLAVRFRARAEQREVERARSQERTRIARELHDTVAHHVSAIAIQAQAGRAVAARNPDAAIKTLATIEEIASRTMVELRVLVGALRDDGDAALVPQAGLAEIEELARTASSDVRVEVEFDGDLDELRPSVSAALYRLAQESITNALRHARNARCVQVQIFGDSHVVRLLVTDDGEPPRSRRGTGFGLVGMAERAARLRGTFEAGPGQGRGWRVEATLPREGIAR